MKLALIILPVHLRLRRSGLRMCQKTGTPWGWCFAFSAAESAVLGYEDDARLGSAYFAPEALHSHCAQLMAEFDVRPAMQIEK